MKYFCHCSHRKSFHKNGMCMTYMETPLGFVKCPCGPKPKPHELSRLADMLNGNMFFPDPMVRIEIIEESREE